MPPLRLLEFRCRFFAGLHHLLRIGLSALFGLVEFLDQFGDDFESCLMDFCWIWEGFSDDVPLASLGPPALWHAWWQESGIAALKIKWTLSGVKTEKQS